MNKLDLTMKIILIYNDFLINKLGTPKEFFTETNKILNKSYEDKNLKVLESALNDIKHQIKYMPLQNLVELNKIFKSNFGSSIEVVKFELENKINKILKRGSIVSDEEYRIILEEKENFDFNNEKIEKINFMLTNYKS